MSVVRINVLQVPAERAELLEQRFAARAGEIDQTDGFESFELLRPTHGTDRYLVVTRWRDEASFEAWLGSEAFGRSRGASAPARPDGQEAPSPARPHGHGHGHGHTASGAGGGEAAPAAEAAELWGFEVVLSAARR